VNELDRAIHALRRSPSATPRLYRALCEGELWALLPFHPEVEGSDIELENGMPLPFALLQDKQGELAPIFSSEERLDECLEQGKVPPKTYSAAAIPATVLLGILGSIGLRAILNKGSRVTGELILPPDLLRDLANGSALAPLGTGSDGPVETRRFKRINPADYPTNLVQPMFEILRQHRNFRAAWIFRGKPEKPLPEGGRQFEVLILMDPRDEVIFHDLNMVVSAAQKSGDAVELGFANEKDPAAIADLFRKVAPFFVAPDYVPPQGD
jgi:hypothetical protein